MASIEWERSGERPLPTLVEAAATVDPPESPANGVKWNGGADPYEATVERLFTLLEENQVAIAALAQIWRHQSRALELTQAELAHTQEALAAERRIRRQA
jgi:hypothetical protein